LVSYITWVCKCLYVVINIRLCKIWVKCHTSVCV
jgi:hypothetical protein